MSIVRRSYCSRWSFVGEQCKIVSSLICRPPLCLKRICVAFAAVSSACLMDAIVICLALQPDLYEQQELPRAEGKLYAQLHRSQLI